MVRPDPEPVSENEEDSYDDEVPDQRSAHSGPGASRRSEKSWVRDRSASRERSLSPRSDRRSVASSQPPKPSKVTLVKSRKNEGMLYLWYFLGFVHMGLLKRMPVFTHIGIHRCSLHRHAGSPICVDWDAEASWTALRVRSPKRTLSAFT